MGAIVGKSNELPLDIGVDNNLVKVSDSGRLATIEYAHLAVHEDGFVTCTDFDNDFDTTPEKFYYISPQTEFQLHSIIVVVGSGAILVRLYESPIITNPGTPITHMRNNRNSSLSDSDRLTTYIGPTISDNGTLLMSVYTGGNLSSNPNGRIGGSGRNGEEFVFDNSTGYLVRLTAGADNLLVGFTHQYYEVSV